MKRLLVLSVLAAITLTGCQGSTRSDTDRTGSPHSNTGSLHSSTDVSFAQQMVPHHRQAVRMARLAERRAVDPRVRALARQVAGAQGPEIATMTGWLRTWGASTDAPMKAMPGMVSDQGIADLGAARGKAFDRLFLTEMIGHHRGAIAMARTEQARGRAPEAVALARRIQAGQSAELPRMRALLG